MHLIIREARSSDLSAIAALFDQYRPFYQQTPDLPLAQAFIQERIEKQESVILVAESNDGLVGFCQLYPTFCSVQAKPIYVLYDLFVHPSARRSGAGKLLMLAVEARAKADGKARMDLTTAKTNLAAQLLYESLGWVRDDVFYTYNREVKPDMPV